MLPRRALTLTPIVCFFATLLLCAACDSRSGPPAAPVPAGQPTLEQKIAHLEAFVRLYGYVRYFHPSDEASELDWTGFAIHGAARVLAARDAAELAATLRELFAPIAPTVQVLAEGEREAAAWTPDDADGLKAEAMAAAVACEHGIEPRYGTVYAGFAAAIPASAIEALGQDPLVARVAADELVTTMDECRGCDVTDGEPRAQKVPWGIRRMGAKTAARGSPPPRGFSQRPRPLSSAAL
jgi:hypothetical protein